MRAASLVPVAAPAELGRKTRALEKLDGRLRPCGASRDRSNRGLLSEIEHQRCQQLRHRWISNERGWERLCSLHKVASEKRDKNDGSQRSPRIENVNQIT